MHNTSSKRWHVRAEEDGYITVFNGNDTHAKPYRLSTCVERLRKGFRAAEGAWTRNGWDITSRNLDKDGMNAHIEATPPKNKLVPKTISMTEAQWRRLEIMTSGENGTPSEMVRELIEDQS